MNKLEKKHIYKLIRNYELEVGEDFLDQNCGFINETALIFWLLGKGYICGDKIEAYSKDRFTDLQSILCGDIDAYSLFPNGVEEEKCYYKSLEILSDLISQVETYQNRLVDILKEKENNERFLDYSSRNDYLEDEYNIAVSLSIQKLNKLVNMKIKGIFK